MFPTCYVLACHPHVMFFYAVAAKGKCNLSLVTHRLLWNYSSWTWRDWRSIVNSCELHRDNSGICSRQCVCVCVYLWSGWSVPAGLHRWRPGSGPWWGADSQIWPGSDWPSRCKSAKTGQTASKHLCECVHDGKDRRTDRRAVNNVFMSVTSTIGRQLSGISVHRVHQKRQRNFAALAATNRLCTRKTKTVLLTKFMSETFFSLGSLDLITMAQTHF